MTAGQRERSCDIRDRKKLQSLPGLVDISTRSHEGSRKCRGNTKEARCERLNNRTEQSGAPACPMEIKVESRTERGLRNGESKVGRPSLVQKSSVPQTHPDNLQCEQKHPECSQKITRKYFCSYSSFMTMTDAAGEKSDTQKPDNSKMKDLDASEFEVTADRLEQLMKSMEVLLSDVEQLRGHCSHQAGELMRAAVELRQQQDELKQSYAELSQDMQGIVESVEDLFNTKSAFEAKEKQAQKLTRQL
ncbi:hypothetical protein FQA47_011776 [Oryzias melastigma]|uniref:Uncharacterized protein n=1 Tax=Oryzias melastigma TaxID=30732 RepID=A0A834L0Z7_ORYME|nr:hypothetical protein FQA47_011776 [Oryzias melastigma]